MRVTDVIVKACIHEEEFCRARPIEPGETPDVFGMFFTVILDGFASEEYVLHKDDPIDIFFDCERAAAVLGVPMRVDVPDSVDVEWPEIQE